MMKCQFCGMEAPRLHTHLRCCPDNPVVWAATRDALDDGEGYIVPANGYKERRTETIYRLPMPGMGLRVVHEYITLR